MSLEPAILVCPVAALSLLAMSLAVPAPALAEDRERIFLVFSGDDVEALEKDAPKFQAPVLENGGFEFAGTQEMEALYAECSEDIGVNAETRRECQLRAANRIMVTQVLQLGGSKLDKKTFDVELQVWSPESNGMLWVKTVEVEARSLRLAAREAYPGLALGYLCWRGVESACDGEVAPGEHTEVTSTVTQATTETLTEIPPADTTPTGSATLNKKDVVAVVRRSAGKVRKCAEAANATGTINIKFMIDPDGSVASATATGEHASTTVGNCVAGVVRRLRFAAFAGEPVAITYPFRLD